MEKICLIFLTCFIVCSTAQVILECSWDRGDCSNSLQQDKTNDQLDWSTGNGKMSNGKGPHRDHGNTKSMARGGKFAFIDPKYVSYNQVTASTARLISTPFSVTSAACADLWYSTDGTGVESMRMTVKDRSGFIRSIKNIETKDDSRQKWRRAYMSWTDSGSGPYVLEIEASVNREYGTDAILAIDDFKVLDEMCNDKNTTDMMEVRLVGGPTASEGVVEVRINNNQWGPVCGDHWTWKEATTVCAMLGQSGGRTNDLPDYSYSNSNFMLDNVDCPNWGTSTLLNCDHGPFGVHTCPKNKVAKQRCNVPEKQSKWKTIRLTDINEGSDYFEARVEVRHNHTWGSICQTGWDYNDANTVCKVFGFNGRSETRGFGKSDDGSPIWLKNVKCRQGTVDFSECTHEGWGNTTGCTHYQDAGVRCYMQKENVPHRCSFESNRNLCGFESVGCGNDGWRQATKNEGLGIRPVDDNNDYDRMVLNTNVNDEGECSAVSPAFITLPATGGVCFEFKYAVSSTSAGELRVMLRSEGQTQVIWNSGQHSASNKWWEVNLDIQDLSGVIIFEGDVGSSYNGIIAVDDVDLDDGNCEAGDSDGGNSDSDDDSTTRPTTHGPSSSKSYSTTTVSSNNQNDVGFKCTFENNLCPNDLQVENGVEIPMTRRKGQTGSDTTGPNSGYNSEYYVYLEGTNRNPSDRAQLKTTRSYTTQGVQCLVFYTSMYGHHIGEVKVYATSPYMQTLETFSPSNPRPGSPNWVERRVEVGVGKGGNFIIEATRGRGYQSDIAFDDVEVRIGSC